MSTLLQNYQFSQLMGSVYTKGNLEFSHDGFSVISPVGNRISIFSLKENVSKTLPIEGTTNFTTINLSPNGCVAIAGNENGEVYTISLISETILSILKLSGNIKLVKYSTDGSMFAVSKQDVVLIYKSHTKKPTLNPFEMLKSISDVDNVIDITWSFDDSLIACLSSNGLLNVYPMKNYSNFKGVTLTVNSGPLRAFFHSHSYNLYTVESQGVVQCWKTDDCSQFFPAESDSAKNVQMKGTEMKRFKPVQTFYYNDYFPKGEKRPKMSSAEYSQLSWLMISGFDGGKFFLHKMPDFNLMQTLQISDLSISTIAINKSADWIAFGIQSVGQLLVWEWESEAYILKQEGHYDIVQCFEFSPASDCIATGGVDGKIKVWNTSTSFCFKTFEEHTAPITGLVFTEKGKAIVSSSLDGTVRAFDLKRYRNFRTFTSPHQVQFGSVAVDSAGALVISGGRDVFDIFLWCMKSGHLLEIFSGHEAAISSVAFSPSPMSSCFVSTSLDKTVRIWQSIESSGVSERIQLDSEGTCLAFSPIGNLIAVGCLNATITFFDLEGKDKGSINGGLYLRSTTLLSAATKYNKTNKLRGKEFRTLCFSPDGNLLLAAGPNKIICMFDVNNQHLLKSYKVSKNSSLNGIDGFVNRRKMTEFGNMDLVEDRDDFENKLPLPGVKTGNMAARTYQNEVRVAAVRFSPDGNSWGAATTEGLLMYTSKNVAIFDPIGADVNVTPRGIKLALRSKHFDRALMMALQLNMRPIIEQIVKKIHIGSVKLLVKELPLKYVKLLFSFMVDELAKTSEIELYIKWLNFLLEFHLMALQKTMDLQASKNNLHRSLAIVRKRTVELLEHNSSISEHIILTNDIVERKALEADVKTEKMETDGNEEESDASMDTDDSDDELIKT